MLHSVQTRDDGHQDVHEHNQSLPPLPSASSSRRTLDAVKIELERCPAQALSSSRHNMLTRTATRTLGRAPQIYRAFSTSRPVSLSPLAAVSNEPVFISSVFNGAIPAFRVLDGEGKVLDEVPEHWRTKAEAIPKEKLVKMYKMMSLLPALVRRARRMRDCLELI